MKRLFALLLGLALLGGCVGAPEAERTEALSTAVMTTEAATETTTEITTEATTEPTTAPPAPVGDLPWRVLDLDSKAGADAKQWLEKERAKREADYEASQKTEYPIGEGRTLLYRSEYPDTQIVLREGDKEIVLLQGNGEDGEKTKIPRIQKILDDRFFLYVWGGWEWIWSIGVYDTLEKREIPYALPDGIDIQNVRLLDVYNGKIYLVDDSADYGPYYGTLHLLRVDTSVLSSGKPAKAIDLMAEIKDKNENGLSYSYLIEGERYYVINDADSFCIYDLQEKMLLFRLSKRLLGVEMDETYYSSYFRTVAVRDDHTIYWYSPDFAPTVLNNSKLVEITLP